MEDENLDVNEEVVNPEEQPEEEAKTVPYDRFAKEVAKRKELEGTLESLTEKQPEHLTTQGKGFGFDDLADNLAVLKPLEQDEVEELRSQAKELDVDPIKFAQSKAWKAHLDSLRVTKKAEARTPEPSNRTAVFEGKSFADVVHASDSKPETKQAAFEAQRDALLRRGNQNM